MFTKMNSITTAIDDDGDEQSLNQDSSIDVDETSRLVDDKQTLWVFSTFQKQLLAVCCASIGVTSIGEVFSWPSSAIPQIKNKWNLTEEQMSWIGSIPLIGMIFGSLLSGVIGDCLGRKSSIIAGNIPLLIGWFILIHPYNLWIIYTGRFFTGFGSMMIMSGANTYITEISSPAYRGRFGTMVLIMYNVGLMLVYLIGMGSWRIMTGILIIPNIISLFAIIPMPESPRWLLIHNRKDEAIKSLQWLSSTSLKKEDVVLEIEKLISDMNTSSGRTFEWKDLLKKGNIVPLLQLLFIHLVRQCMFMQAVMAYASLIFSRINIFDNIYLVPIITEACKIIAIILSLFVVDKIGRKTILIISGMCMSISLIVFSVSLKFSNNGETVSMISIMSFFFFFGIGWAPAPWFLIGELLPDQLRSICSGAIGAYNRLLTFIAINQFLRIQSAMGDFSLFLLIAGICFIASVFVAIFIPEPKGKTLDQIRNSYHNE